MSSPWLRIPLADYEGHMALPGIGQAAMLSDELAAALRRHPASSVAVVGCAGGNGFEHFLPAHPGRVVALDINPDYLGALAARYSSVLPGLELYERDLQGDLGAIAPVELIFAGLVFEYVDVELALRNVRALCVPGGVLVVILQLPTERMAGIAPSPFASLSALASVLRLVVPGELVRQARRAGFEPVESRRRALASGKEFFIQVLRLRDDAAPSANPGIG